MLTIMLLAAVALVCLAGYLLWRVKQDFFGALVAEYDHQLSRDPEYKKRRRVRRQPLREKAKRLARRSLFRIKRPLYLLAVAMGVKR